MKNIEFLKGVFVVWKGTTYRSKSYQHDYELFAIEDKNRENVICRIKKDDAEDYYISQTRIDDSYFCIDYDYGIITISPEKESGNCYIWEIIKYFNETYT